MKEIFNLFISPIVKNNKPPHMEIIDFLDEMFCAKTRDIGRFECVKAFHMPGLFLLAPLFPVQGVGYRWVTRGTEVLVRKDSTTPDVIHVEYYGGKGKKEQVFQLNAEQWRDVSRFLTEAERPEKKR